MSAPLLDAEVLRLTAAAYLSCGSQVEAARALNISRATLQHRLDEAKRRNIIDTSPPEAPHRIYMDVEDGVVIVGSDAHYWPGIISTAHRAFVRACYEVPDVKAVVLNGDVFDGASISRHPPIGWETSPSVVDEIESCKERLGEIEESLSRRQGKVKKIWTLGNHCARFETRLAAVAPEYAKVHGVHLKDHFPTWETAWSVWVNDDVVIKHRYRNGVHATHNNTVNSGKSIVTGHLHSLKVTPWTDYNGTRYGVDTGTLAQAAGPNGPGAQFMDYLEDNPVAWRAGFAVLTFSGGRMIWPEVVHVVDEEAGKVEFRGKVYRV